MSRRTTPGTATATSREYGCRPTARCPLWQRPNFPTSPIVRRSRHEVLGPHVQPQPCSASAPVVASLKRRVHLHFDYVGSVDAQLIDEVAG
jgi:hypothetical protein